MKEAQVLWISTTYRRGNQGMGGLKGRIWVQIQVIWLPGWHVTMTPLCVSVTWQCGSQSLYHTPKFSPKTILVLVPSPLRMPFSLLSNPIEVFIFTFLMLLFATQSFLNFNEVQFCNFFFLMISVSWLLFNLIPFSNCLFRFPSLFLKVLKPSDP